MIINNDNVRNYVEKVVLPNLPFEATFVSAEQVTRHTYVNNIYRVTLNTAQGMVDVYLRQALDHIRADPAAKASPERIFYEERILRQLSEIFERETTPRVLYSDHDNFLLVLSDVRRGAPVLVDELAEGRVHSETGKAIGDTLGILHGKTWGVESFELDPASNERQLQGHFYNRLKQAKEIDPKATQELIYESASAPRTFVAGDFASKNILVSAKDIRFVDLERSFVGDPAFDLGFLMGHYLVEIGNNPELQQDTKKLAKLVMKAYADRLMNFGIDSSVIKGIESRAVRFAGATILYRLFGRAKAGEIRDESRTRLKEYGLELLGGAHSRFVDAISAF